MKAVLPLRFDEIAPDAFIIADDAGQAFAAGAAFVDRYAADQLSDVDMGFLARAGYVVDPQSRDLAYIAALRRAGARFANPADLSYIILVPTLRCDLKCAYCQVSRVDEDRQGFDWTEAQVSDVLTFLDGLATPKIQIEFQGGEPLLRVDILQRVAEFCR